MVRMPKGGERGAHAQGRRERCACPREEREVCMPKGGERTKGEVFKAQEKSEVVCPRKKKRGLT